MATHDTQYDRSPQFNQAEEGEVVIDSTDVGTLALLNKSEIDQQIATAKRYPRSIKQFIAAATELATLDEDTAAECIYALPRGGKTIEGPSARLAEIVLSAWGNARAGARVVSEDERFVTAQGAFYDLQHNVAITYEVKRRITDKRGNRFQDDMIGVTANAACSIALRNAVFKGIPKALWNRIYESSRQVVAGDIRTLANRRADAIKSFAVFGVKPDDIFRVLEVKGADDITLDHLVTLRGIYTAIKEGDTTPEQAFAPPPTQDSHLAAKAGAGLEALKSRNAERANPQTAPVETAAQPSAPEAEAQPEMREPGDDWDEPQEVKPAQRTAKPSARKTDVQHGQALDFNER